MRVSVLLSAVCLTYFAGQALLSFRADPPLTPCTAWEHLRHDGKDQAQRLLSWTHPATCGRSAIVRERTNGGDAITPFAGG